MKSDRPLPARESPFLIEWLATNRTRNQLPISAVCNCDCVFCSNNQNPFAIDRNVFREVDDVRLQLSLMPVHDEPIRMSDSLPGRISEGEAFLHPRFFEILDLVRRKYPFNTLSFTTNGSMLSESFVARLASYRPVEVNLSLHSTRPELWAHIFGKNEREAERALRGLALLRDSAIDICGTIVAMPALCGWDDIEHTYATLVEHGATSMILYWPGHTRTTPAEVIEEIACDLDELTRFGARLRERWSVPLEVLPDTAGRLRVPIRRIVNATARGNPRNGFGPYREVVWLSSQAAVDRLRAGLAGLDPPPPNQHHVIPAPNTTYGGNIIVAGLLMVDDLISAGARAVEQHPDTELVLIPRSPFDGLNRDLVKQPVTAVAEALGRPVWVVDKNGRCDPLIDRVFARETDGLRQIREIVHKLDESLSGKAPLDRALDLVGSFPVETSRGLLTRPQLGEELGAGDLASVRGAKRVHHQIQLVDETRAVSLATWVLASTSDMLALTTVLARTGSSWTIDSLRWRWCEGSTGQPTGGGRATSADNG